MKTKTIMKASIIITVFSLLLFNACSPLREFGRTTVYEGDNNFKHEQPLYDSSKKTIVIVANNDGTELFDMIAPYSLFNETGKANVYIVAKTKEPIVVKKGIFLLPQFTFAEIDSLGINPDAIIIPFLAAIDSAQQDPAIVSWIRKHYSAEMNVLSVCDGSATAAATGLFDGKPITAHASDYEGIKAHYNKPLWTQHVSVVNDGNLYSTAGVSNATEGSLVVIKKMFGEETMKEVSRKVYYPYQLPKIEHQSNGFGFGDKVSVGKKIILRRNKKLGMWMENGIDEFQLAAIMDTYNRTFPKSIESFSENNLPIKTRFNLTIIPTGDVHKAEIEELHVINQSSTTKFNESVFKSARIVKYDSTPNQYMIDQCLNQIKADYGKSFMKVVKLMLDYN